ncbi:MAG: response regulator [Candidatus Rokubacteria bacterium]|nr:response regulator [Candidatus Rokubacteria bacterium]
MLARQTDQLRRLVDDLLDVARVTSGKIVLARRPTDVGELVRRCVATVAAGGSATHHGLTVDAASAWADVDEARVEQIVTNLVGNAVKYTPPGGQVRVTLGRVDGELRLRVADDGIGLAPDMCARVFDLFVQGDRGADRRQGGLGVGLTLVRRLAELHGGRVEAASDGVGRGATFAVWLPAIETPAAVGTPATAPPRVPAASLRLVIVEDHTDARRMLADLLSLSGHEVTEAGDGPAGIELIARVAPDVALIDVGLPGCTGYEVVERLRGLGTATLLVALTGYGQPEDRWRALNAGFDAHFVKPVDGDALVDMLSRLGAPSASRV